MAGGAGTPHDLLSQTHWPTEPLPPVIQEVPTRVGTFGTGAPTASQPQLAPAANSGSEKVPTTVGRDSLRSSLRKPLAVADEIEGRKLAKRYGVAFEDWQSLPATYAKRRSGGA